ncbi:hypothetical protein Tco_1158333, partial [Tanacetum coccineum]
CVVKTGYKISRDSCKISRDSCISVQHQAILDHKKAIDSTGPRSASGSLGFRAELSIFFLEVLTLNGTDDKDDGDG